jgi:hypothetical protein
MTVIKIALTTQGCTLEVRESGVLFTKVVRDEQLSDYLASNGASEKLIETVIKRLKCRMAARLFSFDSPLCAA